MGYALRIDENKTDCSFYLDVVDAANTNNIIHYDGTGGSREVFATGIRAGDVYVRVYGLDFEIE